MGIIMKNVTREKLKIKLASVGLIELSDYLILYKCLCSNKNYQKKFDKVLKKRFANTHKFFKHDINNFILLL